MSKHVQDFERRLGVDLLIKPEDGKEKIKDKDQIQQRAVVSEFCTVLLKLKIYISVLILLRLKM